MAEALIKNGKHTVTALTRSDSQSTLPEGIIVKKVNYDDQSTLVEALKGQDALIITLGSQASSDTDEKLIRAAGEAGVKWILPNEWGPDNADETVTRDVFVLQGKGMPPKNSIYSLILLTPLDKNRDFIASLNRSSYIALSTGFWYEWSLAIPSAFGFDFKNRSLTFFDEGKTPISVSTWPQVGRAVASILSLPQADLDTIRNKIVYVKSFTVSQRDMFDSALRVTGTKEADWTINKEPAHERYANGIAEMKQGSRDGFAKMLYTRIFYDDGNGDFETRRGVSNKLLGLPQENIDEATNRAIKRSEQSPWS